MFRNILASMVLCLSITFTVFHTSRAEPAIENAETRQAMADLMVNKEQFIRPMAKALVDCLNTKIDRSGIFAGCDSRLGAMQALWGVMSYSWLTNDNRFGPLIRQRLSPRSIKKEWRRLQKGTENYSAFEQGWFLRLTLDHMRIYKRHDLVPVADWMVNNILSTWHRTPPDWQAKTVDNPAWLLLSMHGYLAERDNPLFHRVYDLIREHYLDNSKPCDFGADAGQGMSVCALQMVLAGRVQQPEFQRIWLESFLPAPSAIQALSDIESADQMAANFVRAGAFWRSWMQQNDELWLKLYLDHLQHVGQIDFAAITSKFAGSTAYGILALAPLWYWQQIQEG